MTRDAFVVRRVVCHPGRPFLVWGGELVSPFFTGFDYHEEIGVFKTGFDASDH